MGRLRRQVVERPWAHGALRNHKHGAKNRQGNGRHRNKRKCGDGRQSGRISGPGLSALTATNEQPYIGKPFQVNNVPVQNQVNDRVFWIGANNSTPMPVVLNSNQNPVQFSSPTTGSTVDVAGTVTKAPATSDAASQWPLNDPDLGRLEKDGAYISATQVNRAQ